MLFIPLVSCDDSIKDDALLLVNYQKDIEKLEDELNLKVESYNSRKAKIKPTSVNDLTSFYKDLDSIDAKRIQLYLNQIGVLNSYLSNDINENVVNKLRFEIENTEGFSDLRTVLDSFLDVQSFVNAIEENIEMLNNNDKFYEWNVKVAEKALIENLYMYLNAQFNESYISYDKLGKIDLLDDAPEDVRTTYRNFRYLFADYDDDYARKLCETYGIYEIWGTQIGEYMYGGDWIVDFLVEKSTNKELVNQEISITLGRSIDCEEITETDDLIGFFDIENREDFGMPFENNSKYKMFVIKAEYECFQMDGSGYAKHTSYVPLVKISKGEFGKIDTRWLVY